MDYVTIKWLHVLSSTVLFGTGIGSAFYLLLAATGHDARAVAVVSRYVVITDWVFTATTAVLQPLTGFWMLHRVPGLAWSTPWVAWSIGLYALAIACWIPVVWIQLRLRDIAAQAARTGPRLPARYWQLFRWWIGLGAVAFAAFLAIFWMMVTKQVPFGG